jgi:hypothetical protein
MMARSIAWGNAHELPFGWGASSCGDHRAARFGGLVNAINVSGGTAADLQAFRHATSSSKFHSALQGCRCHWIEVFRVQYFRGASGASVQLLNYNGGVHDTRSIMLDDLRRAFTFAGQALS